ncbi:hypothetical protein OJ996_00165 [Luteolibacter sp. GHJ8]|uniref:Uncharacterized protein n=1 Tax=Luteolibacter rhizosphaerae TaxID=2989719 RepID=A0ABT3FWJ4_9BACT|nr:hypothetical protein [Luteolibacter rhizosphaerae]MCW1911966.1 hypothetical protein [Luteolibacter rhizosphaerae]
MNETHLNPRPRTRRIIVATGLCFPICAGAILAADFPIGVNFTETASHMLDAGETAGAPGFEHTNWNNRGRWGNAGPLNDNTGTATAVNLKWDSTNLWANNANETLGGNHKMMKGYLDSNGTAITAPFDGVFGNSDDKPIMLLTGMNAWMTAKGLTSYSVVIYSDGDDGTGNRASRIWLAAANPGSPVAGDPGLGGDLTSRVDVIDNSNWGTTPTFTRVTGTSGTGNYVVFSGQTADAFYIRVDEAGSVPLRCPVNAIQIIGTNQVNLADTDNDGMPDVWESNFGLNPNDNGSVNPDNGPSGDPDGDGRTNIQEYNSGNNSTNPNNPDTDSDGLEDGAEFTAGTNPNNTDSDNDLLPDGWEVANNLNPLDDGTTNINNGPDGDPDSDGLVNILEFEFGADPNDGDTDDDTLSDGVESKTGFWGGEVATGTDPVKVDSDADGLADNLENPEAAYVAGITPGTDPNLSDSDGDGTNDRWEFLLGTNPASDTSNVPKVAVTNHSFELPATATFIQGVPTNWTLANGPAPEDAFVENTASVGMSGGDGTQFVGIEQDTAYLHQDTGVAFSPNTTYIVDLASGYRVGYGTSRVELGLFSSTAVGTDLGYPGWMDINGVITTSGNPDADGIYNKFRDASALATIGSGALGRAYAFVTGATPPPGNIVVFVRQDGGGRELVDNVRILAIPNSTDVDNDDLPDAWELANRLDPRSATGDNGATGDPDGDGFTNAEELAAGSDPDFAGSTPVVVEPSIISSGFNGTAFEVTVGSLDAAKTYTLARGLNLGGFTPIGTTFTGGTTHTFIDTTPPPGRAFYRVQETP